jgi:acetyl esterase/lipase
MTVAPKLGYYIHEVKVNDTVLTAVSEGNYSFAMPAKDVTVSVFFDFDFTAIADELQVLNDADDALEAASAALNSAVANKADTATLNARVAELQNAIAVAEAAAKAYTDAGVPYELHIYPDAPHGFALGNAITKKKTEKHDNPCIAQWVSHAAAWADYLSQNPDLIPAVE